MVDVEYVYECRNSSTGKEPGDIKRFIVTSAEDKENFSKSGTIPVSSKREVLTVDINIRF